MKSLVYEYKENKENEIKELINRQIELKREIEKKDIEYKYNSLRKEYEGLKIKLDEINQIQSKEKKKETEFSEKIDELNQETDILLEEIDKWQM